MISSFVNCVFTERENFTAFENEHVENTHTKLNIDIYVSLRLRVQNAVSPQPCVGKLGKSPLLLNFLVSTLRIIF